MTDFKHSLIHLSDRIFASFPDSEIGLAKTLDRNLLKTIIKKDPRMRTETDINQLTEILPYVEFFKTK